MKTKSEFFKQSVNKLKQTGQVELHMDDFAAEAKDMMEDKKEQTKMKIK